MGELRFCRTNVLGPELFDFVVTGAGGICEASVEGRGRGRGGGGGRDAAAGGPGIVSGTGVATPLWNGSAMLLLAYELTKNIENKGEGYTYNDLGQLTICYEPNEKDPNLQGDLAGRYCHDHY